MLSLKTRNAAIRAARELYYPYSVITALENATSESEINRIMATARERSSDSDVVPIRKKKNKKS